MAMILAVDDEKDILILIKNSLFLDNHITTTETSGKNVLKMDLSIFDLILLDIMMPEIDGFELCNRIHIKTDCPILFLTAKVMEDDIIYGLGIGADDYILKPFGVGELRARVNVDLRREKREKHNIINLGKINFNLSAKEIMIEGEIIYLTKSEYFICEFLARNSGQVFSKEKIYESIFGYDGESNSSVITEHVKNIRAKFAKLDISPIKTVWGIGYKWNK